MPTIEVNPQETAWLDKVCALLAQDNKMQWSIGDTLLEGEQWHAPGITGRELHEFKKDQKRRNENSDTRIAEEGDEKPVGYQMGMKGHDPIEEVAKRSGYDKSTLLDFARVAKKFPATKRFANLTWSHHQACAAGWLTDKQSIDLLERAETQKLSVGKLRQLVSEKNTDDFAGKGYKSLSFKLPQTIVNKLEKIAKQEKRKMGSLIEQAVDLLLEEYTDNKKKKAA